MKIKCLCCKLEIEKINKQHKYCSNCGKFHKNKYTNSLTIIRSLTSKIINLKQRLRMYE